MNRFLGIYLDERLAVLAGGVALVQRAASSADDEEVRAFLDAVHGELSDDFRAADQVMRSLGLTPKARKQQIARLAEKLGRLKLNGTLVKPSPLSRVVELEGVSAMLGASLLLWRTLAQIESAEAKADAERRAERMSGRLTELMPLRDRVASAKLG